MPTEPVDPSADAETDEPDARPAEGPEGDAVELDDTDEIEIEIGVVVVVDDDEDDDEEEVAAPVAAPVVVAVVPRPSPTPGRPPGAREEPPPPFGVGERVILISNTRPRTRSAIGDCPGGSRGVVETVLSQTAIVRFERHPDFKEVVAFTCLETAETPERAAELRLLMVEPVRVSDRGPRPPVDRSDWAASTAVEAAPSPAPAASPVVAPKPAPAGRPPEESVPSTKPAAAPAAAVKAPAATIPTAAAKPIAKPVSAAKTAPVSVVTPATQTKPAAKA